MRLPGKIDWTVSSFPGVWMWLCMCEHISVGGVSNREQSVAKVQCSVNGNRLRDWCSLPYSHTWPPVSFISLTPRTHDWIVIETQISSHTPFTRARLPKLAHRDNLINYACILTTISNGASVIILALKVLLPAHIVPEWMYGPYVLITTSAATLLAVSWPFSPTCLPFFCFTFCGHFPCLSISRLRHDLPTQGCMKRSNPICALSTPYGRDFKSLQANRIAFVSKLHFTFRPVLSTSACPLSNVCTCVGTCRSSGPDHGPGHRRRHCLSMCKKN